MPVLYLSSDPSTTAALGMLGAVLILVITIACIIRWIFKRR